MSRPRANAAGVVTYHDRAWMLGGKMHKSTEYLNRSSTVWTEGMELNEPKAGHCAVTQRGGKVVVITGGKTTFKTDERFDLDTWSHQFSVALHHKRYSHACAILKQTFASDAILIAGYKKITILKFLYFLGTHFFPMTNLKNESMRNNSGFA